MSEELKAALARIACLEGEIAKRDETIARLEPQLNRAIQANYDLREELAACRVAVENCELFRARIAELEARIVWLECEAQVNAAPVSEAKAQGVVMPGRMKEPSPLWNDVRTTSVGFPLNREEIAEARAFNLALDEVARLNAAPVQQVSVPDVLREAIKWADHLCFECGALVQTRAPSVHVYNKTFEAVQAAKAMLAAAPAAPAADAGLVEALEEIARSETAVGDIARSALAARRSKGVV